MLDIPIGYTRCAYMLHKRCLQTTLEVPICYTRGAYMLVMVFLKKSGFINQQISIVCHTIFRNCKHGQIIVCEIVSVLKTVLYAIYRNKENL